MTTNATHSSCPSTQLSSTDINVVQTSWAKSEPKCYEFGASMMKTLFRDHPEYRSLFRYGDIPEEDWLQSQTFLSSMRITIKGLNTLVDALGDPDKLESVLTKNVEFHKKINITAKHYIDLKKSMIETFFNYLAKEDAEVWKTVLDVVFGTILEGYGETDP